MAAVRMAVSLLVTWAVLVVLFLAPSPLPEQWRYYIYSPHERGLVDADHARRTHSGVHR